MHPQILTLGLKLPMMKFIRNVSTFYRIVPSQLSGVAWRTVFGFEALCIMKVPDACQREISSAAYVLWKTS